MPMNQPQFDELNFCRQKLSRAQMELAEALQAARKAGPNGQKFVDRINQAKQSVSTMADQAQEALLHN